MIISPEHLKIKVMDETNEEFDYSMSHGMMKRICHQKPERSFFLRGKQIPLCSRCLGIYSSYILSLILLYFFGRYIYISSSVMIFLLFVGFVPIFVDGITQLKGLRQSNNYLRLFTGVLFGSTMACVTYFFVQRILEMFIN
jgi:uncharacterized membrane protein